MNFNMDEIIFEVKEKIAFITINRPGNLNALTDDIIDKLESFIDKLAIDKSVRFVILKSNGKAFCSGVDVKGKEYNPLNAREFLIKLNRVFNKLESLPQPSLSLVQGAAVAGGFELALSTTFRFATKNAKFGLPEVKLGLVAAGGASFRLPRLIGLGRALEIALTGDLILGEDAYNTGLVNRLFDNYDDMMKGSEEFANKIVSNAPLALEFVKDSFYHNVNNPKELATLLEILSASVNHYSEDKKEGIKAFFEKRKPEFHYK
jgi:enoyl-CoA hydratase/carnithine racemase